MLRRRIPIPALSQSEVFVVTVAVGITCIKGANGMFYLTTHSTHFILRLFGVRHMIKDHSDSERRNPLPSLHGIFPISSKGFFICAIPQTG